MNFGTPYTINSRINVRIGPEKIMIDSYTASMIVKYIPDEKCKVNAFRYLAKINDPLIRKELASKRHMNKEIFLTLQADTNNNVLSNLLKNNHTTQRFTYKVLKRIIIERDSELSIIIAENINSFKEKYNLKLSSLLYKHRDYRVRMGLLHELNIGVPTKIVKKLLKDKNKEVAKKAIIELKERKQQNKAHKPDMMCQTD